MDNNSQRFVLPCCRVTPPDSPNGVCSTRLHGEGVRRGRLTPPGNTVRSVTIRHTLFQTAALMLLILSALLLCSCDSKTENESNLRQRQAGDSTALSSPPDSVVIELAGADSQTVFDLLEDGHEVEYKSSVIGIFVTAINSIENSAGAYWIYSVNDSVPQVACDKYVTKNGDVVKWHFRNMRE